MKHCRPLLSRLVPLSLTALLVSACSPVGNGIGPVRIEINSPTGVANATSARIFECIRGQFGATLFFSDGSAGDFAARARWSSSNSAIVRVSNGDEPAPAPATGFFPAGVFTPVAPGTATVTANYLGLTDSIEVSVGTPTNIAIHTLDPQNGLLVDPPGNAFRIGVGTGAGLAVTALLDNVDSNITPAATFAFVTPNDAVATIGSSTGVILGVAQGGPLVARASFAPCAQTVTTSVAVAPVQNISIVPEFGSDSLFVGNTESFTVMADFGSGPEQDVSLQSLLTSSLVSAAQFSSIFGASNQLLALAAGGPISVGATFTQGTPAVVVTATPISVTTVAGTFDSISITPATASIVAGSDQVAQYNVIANYTGGATQLVTRRATWVSSDPTIGQILAASTQAGQARSAGLIPGTTTFTATVGGAATTSTTVTATATLTTTAAPAPP